MVLIIEGRSDPRGEDLSLFGCFGALRAAFEVVFHCLSVAQGKSVEDVIVQDFFCQVPNCGIRPSALLIDYGRRSNPFTFDTACVSERILLTRENGGAGSTGN